MPRAPRTSPSSVLLRRRSLHPHGGNSMQLRPSLQERERERRARKEGQSFPPRPSPRMGGRCAPAHVLRRAPASRCVHVARMTPNRKKTHEDDQEDLHGEHTAVDTRTPFFLTEETARSREGRSTGRRRTSMTESGGHTPWTPAPPSLPLTLPRALLSERRGGRVSTA